MRSNIKPKPSQGERVINVLALEILPYVFLLDNEAKSTLTKTE
jgi:hypothetical protein